MGLDGSIQADKVIYGLHRLRDIAATMENNLEKKIENDMDSWSRAQGRVGIGLRRGRISKAVIGGNWREKIQTGRGCSGTLASSTYCTALTTMGAKKMTSSWKPRQATSPLQKNPNGSTSCNQPWNPE